MRSRALYLFLTLFISACVGAETTDQKPFSKLPYSPSLNLESLDHNADPCEDFYQYACGGWIENNPIPADQSRWSTFGKTSADNQRYLWGILQDLSDPTKQRNEAQAQMGDYFAACMNLEHIESLGSTPIDPELKRINSITAKAQLGSLIGELIQHTDARAFFLAIGAQQDAKDSSKVIGALYAGGLGLPDRDYYFDDSENRQDTRKAYIAHLESMFRLLGETEAQASTSASTVMRIETALAGASLTRVESRDPYKTYNPKSLDDLQIFAPVIDWESLFKITEFEPGQWLNVTQPAFVLEIQAIIERESLGDLKTYLTWALVNTRAGLLSQRFRDQDFAFYSTHLRGVTEQRPRWRTCVARVDIQLGESLGKEFVERNFPPERKKEVKHMSLLIQQAMAERIEQISWMSQETRQEAHEKLRKMREKIGYPNSWRDYSPIVVDRNDFYGNVTRATGFDLSRQMKKIGQAVDLDEWLMTPAAVNAYYDPSRNDMNFPAGVLMPPLYDPKMDAAPNYGNTGGTIGHELIHGFDDEGRQYDEDGNLRNWWTDDDAKAFEERADCIREQYASYRVIDDIFINSTLTSGEDIGDLGGLILAWHAWKKETEQEELEVMDGFTPDQRFFVGFAQWACADERPEALRLHATTDPHSPPKHRINGVVVNMPEFGEAFNCQAGAAMVKPKEKVCRIW
jgi:putative endopeptidase